MYRTKLELALFSAAMLLMMMLSGLATLVLRPLVLLWEALEPASNIGRSVRRKRWHPAN